MFIKTFFVPRGIKLPLFIPTLLILSLLYGNILLLKAELSLVERSAKLSIVLISISSANFLKIFS